MVCLDLNNSDIKEWYDAVGLEETYKQLILHNYSLPFYTQFVKNSELPLMTHRRVKDMYSSMFANSDKIEIKNIEELKDIAPNAQAAFWKNVFYFADRVEAGDAFEEGFHKIFQTLTDPIIRKDLLKIGKELLRVRLKNQGVSLSKHLEEQSEYNKLYGDELLDFLVEEEIAKEFVTWVEYSNTISNPLTSTLEQKLSFFKAERLTSAISALIKFFRKIQNLLGLYKKNKKTLHSYFSDIEKGQYRETQANLENFHIIPSPSAIEVKKGSSHNIYNTQEQRIHYGIISNIFDQIKSKTPYKEPKVPYTNDEVLELSMGIFIKHYLKSSNESTEAFAKSLEEIPNSKFIIQEFLPKEKRDISVPKFINSRNYSIVYSDLQDIINKQQLPQLSEEDLEDDEGSSFWESQSEKADQKEHFKSFSKLIQTYISTIPLHKEATVQRTYYTEEGNKEVHNIKLQTLVDPLKVYALTVRVTSNSNNSLERLQKMIVFSSDPANIEVKAFLDKFLFDSFLVDSEVNTKELLPELKEYILNLHQESQLQESGARFKVLNMDLYFSLTKAFDLFSREYRMIYTDQDGRGNVLSINPSHTNVVNMQLSKWELAWENGGINLYTKNKIIFDQGFGADFSESYGKLITINDRAKFLDKKLIQATRFFKMLGVNLSENYIKFTLAHFLDKKGVTTLTPEYKSIYTSQDLDENSIFSYEELAGLVGQLVKFNDIAKSSDNQKKMFNPYFIDKENPKQGMVVRLRKAARGNAFFDEAVTLSVFLDAENKNRYGHQNESLLLNFGNNILSDTTRFDNYTQNIGSFASSKFNPLVKEYNTLTDRQRSNLKIISSLGTKSIKVNEEGSTESTLIPKQTVNEHTPDSFSVNNANLSLEETKTLDGKVVMPFHVGRLEASKTTSFFSGIWFGGATLIDKKGVPTKKATDIIKNYADAEFNRIKDEFSFLKEFIDQAPRNKTSSEGIFSIDISETSLRSLEFYAEEDIIQGYDTGNILINEDGSLSRDNVLNEKAPRALVFSQALEGALSISAKETYYDMLNGEEVLEGKLDSEISAQLNLFLENHLDIKDELDHLHKAFYFNKTDFKSKKDQKIVDLQTNLEFYTSGDKDFRRDLNLKMFYLNSLVNNLGFSRILFGDYAINNKNNNDDYSKRVKALEASVKSADFVLTDPSKGIDKDFQTMKIVMEIDAGDTEEGKSGVTGEFIDSDDGQTWISVYHHRKLIYGLGKSTVKSTIIIDKVQEGITLSKKEQATLESDEFVNILKTRAFGRDMDIKTGLFAITKQFSALPTSISKEVYDQNATKVFTTSESYFSRPIFKNGKGSTKLVTQEIINGVVKYFEWIDDGTRTPFYNRMMLLEGFRKEEDGSWMYRGNEAELDAISPTSAHKRKKMNVWDGNPKTFLESIHNQEYDITEDNLYGLQVDNPAGKNYIVDPTQELEIILSEINGDVEVYNHKGDMLSSFTPDEIVSEYGDRSIVRDNNSFRMAKSEVLEGSGDPKFEYFFEKIRKNLEETGGDPQLVNFFNTTNGEPDHSVNLPLVKDKFVQMLFSHFTKGVLSQKRQGESKAMFSPRGLGVLKRLEISTINEKKERNWTVVQKGTVEYLSNIQDANKNNFVDKGFTYNGKEKEGELNTLLPLLDIMEKEGDVYFIDELRHLKPRIQNGKITGNFSEAVMPNSSFKQSDFEISSDQRFMSGVRIPSQDKGTSANLEWVEIMEFTYGNTIAVSKEIQELSGSDFDIDKLFVSYVEGYYEKINEENEAKEYTFVSYEDNFDHYLKYSLEKDNLLKETIKKLKFESKDLQNLNSRKNNLKETKEELENLIKTKNSPLVGKINIIKEKIRENKIDKFELNEEDSVTAEELKIITREIFTPSILKQEEVVDALHKLKKETNSKERSAEVEKELDLEKSRLTIMRSEFYKNNPVENKLTLPKRKSLRKNSLLKYNLDLANKIFKQEIQEFKSDPENAPYFEELDLYYSVRDYLSDLYLETSETNKIIQAQALGEIGYPTNQKEYYNSNNSYNGYINNDLLYKKQALLTHNYDTYSRITSVTPLKELESKFDLVNMDTYRREIKLSPHSVLYQRDYAVKVQASANGISAAVIANLAGLVLTRIGVQTNPSHHISITDQHGDTTFHNKFTEKISIPEGEEDVLAWVSSLITATTDEMKEGVLAMFKLHAEALDVFATGLVMGIHPEILVTIINDSSIQKALKGATKNPLQIAKGFTLGELLGNKREFSEKETANIKIVEGKIISGTVDTFLRLLDISKQNKSVAAYVRVKKGFKPTMDEFMKLVQHGLDLNLDHSSLEIEFFKRDYIQDYKDSSSEHVAYSLPKFLKDSEGMKQIFNFMSKIVPEMHDITSKYLIETSTPYHMMFNHMLRNTNRTPYLIPLIKKELYKAVVGEVARNTGKFKLNASLMVDVAGSSGTLADRFLELRKKYEDVSDVIDSPIFAKLNADLAVYKKKRASNGGVVDSMYTSTFSINTFARITPEMQSNMMDEYHRLSKYPDSEVKSFLEDLFSYFIIKDGLGYDPRSIGKIFPNNKFLDISDGLKKYMENDSFRSQIFRGKLEERILLDIRNKDFIKTIPSKLPNKLKMVEVLEGSNGTNNLTGVVAISKSNNYLFRNNRTLENDSYPRVVRLSKEVGTVKLDFIYKMLSDEENVVRYIRTPLLGTSNMHASIAENNIAAPEQDLSVIADALIKSASDYQNSSENTLEWRNKIVEEILNQLSYIRELEAHRETKATKESISNLSVLINAFEQEGVDKTKKEEVTPPINQIDYRQSNLEFALTNPTHSNPATSKPWSSRTWNKSQEQWRRYMSGGIQYKAKVYVDTEQAYQANKKDFLATKTTDKLMANLIYIKLKTYPKLVEGIDAKGGMAYLNSMSHQPTSKNSYWETGGGDGFMRALKEGYLYLKSQPKITDLLGKPQKEDAPEGSQLDLFSPENGSTKSEKC